MIYSLKWVFRYMILKTVDLGEVSPGRELDQPASLEHSPAPYTGSAQCAGIEGRWPVSISGRDPVPITMFLQTSMHTSCY